MKQFDTFSVIEHSNIAFSFNSYKFHHITVVGIGAYSKSVRMMVAHNLESTWKRIRRNHTGSQLIGCRFEIEIMSGIKCPNSRLQ